MSGVHDDNALAAAWHEVRQVLQDEPRHAALLQLCSEPPALDPQSMVPGTVALARALSDAGLADPARRVWTALRDQHPGLPAGWVGLAHLASRQQRWTEAMACWNAALQRFPDRNHPLWKVGLGRAMLRLGLHDDAAQCLQQALDLHPEEIGARQMLVNLLDKTGRLAEALRTIDDRRESCLAVVPLQFQYLKLMTRRGRVAEAAALAEQLLHAATTLDPFPGIVRLLPELAARSDTMRLARLAGDRLAAIDPATLPAAGRQLRNELRLRVALQQGDHAGFLALLAPLEAAELPTGLHDAGTDMARRLARPLREALDAPKVFGIGLSKTATTSLSEALTLLGLRSAHYQNPLSFEVLDAEQALYFDACNDTPISHCFEALYHSFPQAKFIYTTRPLEGWLPSLRKHHRHHFGSSDWGELRTLTARLPLPVAAVEAALYFNHPDALSAWHAHDQRVRRFFADKPSGRFLELDVFAGQGWPELCAFLGVPVPAAPFPHENAVR